MRSAPESSSRRRIFSLSAPIFVRECRRWSPASHDLRFKPRNERKKEAERRQTLSRILRNFRCGARFAKRARLWAFHHGSCPREYFIPRAQPGPGFVTHRPNAAGLPRQPMRHIQRCTSRAGHSAGRLMPGLPGNGGDEPPPAGAVPAFRQTGSPAGVLHDKRNEASYHIQRPYVNKKETKYRNSVRTSARTQPFQSAI